MDVGVYLPQVGFTWDELRTRAIACDRAGIPSLWLMDHLYPPGMPAVPSFEAWTTATALAAVTERLRIGHLVLANGLRHPAVLAKMAITLDHASGGRLNLGLGSGSWAQEFRELGLPFPSDAMRASELDEALTIVKRLFAEEVVDFTGRHYRLAGVPSRPRPVQRPHPPIHVGGAGPRRTLPLVARHADVWNCPTYALGQLPERLARLHEECRTIGRDPASLGVTEEAVLALVARRDRVDEARATALRRFGGPGWAFETHGYCGTPDDVLGRLEERRALGVDGVVFFLHDRASTETIELLAREIVPAAARFEGR
jgi:alkanesulfonate monooxygenase SsuD/methylene tetrahydromethanopterin reductase-like flavin-dependent oxidoreductase (luciferase family)